MKTLCAALALGTAISGVALADQPTTFTGGAPAMNAASGDPYL
ncbi:MAG: hypothetical protein ACREPJ_08435 [Rhodanobacteraceae bacterium]